jgi:hypothetical protein
MAAEAGVAGLHDRLAARGDAQLLKDRREVVGDGLLGEVEPAGDRRVGTVVLVLGLFAARETGATGRSFLVLWALGLAILLAGGVQSLIAGNQDTILFPIGGITATLAALVSSIFIACNKRLAGSPRRWAPLAYGAGTIITGFFQGEEHTLQVNLADLTNNLLMLLIAGAFFIGVRAAR